MDANREFLRHTLATLAYRAAKTLRGAPESFGHYELSEGGKSRDEVLAHMGA